MCMSCNLMDAFGLFAASGIKKTPHLIRPRLSRRRFVNGSAAFAAMLSASALASTSASSQPSVFDNKNTGDEPAVIFRGGRIYTVNAAEPWAEAVAIRGKKIVAVGADAQVSKLAGPATRVVELNGRMMLPGFVEGHIHPFLGSFFTEGIDLQVPTLDEALDVIARQAGKATSGVVRGFGWRVDMFPPEGPNKAYLDRILPDRPAFFFSIDGHGLWLNSKALETAGVNRNTPDPIPGFSYFVRDSKGDATGYVLEVAAVLQAVNAIEPISVEAMGRLLEGWLPKASAAGITTVYDAGVPPIGNDQGALIEIYTDLEREQRLPFRVVASYMIKGPPTEHAAADALALRRRINTELVEARMLKIVGDGTAEGHTALLLEPYTDKPNTLGVSPFSQEQFNKMVVDAEAVGIDVHIHACGEATTRMALNAFQAAIAASPHYDRRHSMAHLVLVDDADLPRFGQLGVVAQFSANWMSADPDSVDILLERYGPERQSKIYRPRSVLQTGGAISFGTDWPAAGYFATYKPLDAIQVAMTRQLIGKPDAAVLEPVDQRLSVEQAVHANTMGSAYQLRLEDQLGSIEVGKFADLIVLEKDIFAIDPHDIAKVRVEMTMMNGRFTHGGRA